MRENYAHTLRDLSDVHFADAAKIVLVQDNLNTHKPASLYEAFPAAEARRFVRTPLYAGPETVVSPDLVERAYSAFQELDSTNPELLDLQNLLRGEMRCATSGLKSSKARIKYVLAVGS